MVKELKIKVKEPVVKELTAKELIAELKNLYLRTDSEVLGRGLYHRLIADISVMRPGHVDKDTSLIVRIKEIILELEKIV